MITGEVAKPRTGRPEGERMRDLQRKIERGTPWIVARTSFGASPQPPASN
jgi:hypothetical protein